MGAAHFKKPGRLLTPSDYKQVFDNNQFKASNKEFLVLAYRKPCLHTPSKQAISRLGLVVSKKNVHRAVDRNRVKRNIREFFRQSVYKEKLGADVVVLARRGVNHNSNHALRKSLDILFASIHKQVKKTGRQNEKDI